MTINEKIKIAKQIQNLCKEQVELSAKLHDYELGDSGFKWFRKYNKIERELLENNDYLKIDNEDDDKKED